MKKILFTVLAMTLLLTGCSSKPAKDAENTGKDAGHAVEQGAEDIGDDIKDGAEKVGEYAKIAIDDVKGLIDGEEDFTLVDLRDEDAYNKGHIKGAVRISGDELEDRAGTELTDKDKKIVVYDEDGSRSKEAAQKLIDMGYTNVHDMGGISEWTYDTTTEMPAVKAEPSDQLTAQ